MKSPVLTRGGVGAGVWLSSFLESGAYAEVGKGRVLLAWGECTAEKRPLGEGVSFYVPDFFLREGLPWRHFSCFGVFGVEEVGDLLRGEGCSGINWDIPREGEFGGLVSKVLSEIDLGKIEKAVPTAAMTSSETLSGDDRGSIISRSLAGKSGGVAYGFWDDRGGIIGVTPESLFSREGATFCVEAVAGTGVGAKKWTPTPKDKEEHAVVLRDIAERCLAVSEDGKVKSGRTLAVRFGNLWHLRTKVTFPSTMRSGFPTMVSRLHPTPAVGISPRGNWRIRCREFDAGERWRHGAPFAICLGDGSLERCMVAIRCLQWKKGEGLQIRAGCGVIKKSSPEGEYQELLEKLSTVRQILGA
jgi:menaquinone-specific isochorismate synthase